MIDGEVKPPVGHYVAFYRFSADGGKTWGACDGEGIVPENRDFNRYAFFDVQ